MEIKIMQIYYREAHKQFLDPCFIPYNNMAGASPFFENEVMVRFISQYYHVGCDYFGCVSWSFRRKIKLRGGIVDFKYIEKKIHESPNTDVFSFFSSSRPHNPFHPHSNGHGHALLTLTQMLMDRMGIKIDISQYIAERHVYMNYFIAKPGVYDQYINTFLQPAMDIMSNEDDSEFYKLLWTDSLYIAQTIPHLERRRLQTMIGVPYYPFHAFICERLFTLWLSLHKNITLNQIV